MGCLNTATLEGAYLLDAVTVMVPELPPFDIWPYGITAKQ